MTTATTGSTYVIVTDYGIAKRIGFDTLVKNVSEIIPVPSGGIIMWSTATTIPAGWESYVIPNVAPPVGLEYIKKI